MQIYNACHGGHHAQRREMISAAIFGWGVWHGTTMAAAAAMVGYAGSLVLAWAMDVLGGRK